MKKVATVLTVSDELLDDATGTQVQSYLNSRLSLFIRTETERQILRGAGTNELVGLFGRSGINAYPAGTDSPAVALFKALITTRGSSNLAPSGIVMHPWNYAAARRGTTTTGEFLGGRPFGNAPQADPYVDTLWGVPVTLSTTVGLGTALVGAFADGARIYQRGGVTLEASNSHASYFQNNLVMLRAEARQVLACFRPGAFTQVTGLGTAI